MVMAETFSHSVLRTSLAKLLESTAEGLLAMKLQATFDLLLPPVRPACQPCCESCQWPAQGICFSKR